MKILFLTFFGLVALVGVALMIRNTRVNKIEGAILAALLMVFFVLHGLNWVFHSAIIAAIDFGVILLGLLMLVISAVRQSFWRANNRV